jgi:hypothetical protein
MLLRQPCTLMEEEEEEEEELISDTRINDTS